MVRSLDGTYYHLIDHQFTNTKSTFVGIIMSLLVELQLEKMDTVIFTYGADNGLLFSITSKEHYRRSEMLANIHNYQEN